jgi:hypothetical protein
MLPLPIRPFALLVGLVALVAAACSPSPTPAPSTAAQPSVIPVIIGDQVKGPFRFVFSYIDPETNGPAASPDRKTQVAFIAPGQTDPGAAADATFMWTIEGTVGQYYLNTQFPTSGDWKAVFMTSAPGKPQESIGVSFQVHDDLPLVNVGEPAPASDNAVASDVGGDLKQISTDPNPDPAFYEISVKDALAQHAPFVLVFATPAFCQSRTCGPALDRVKAGSQGAPSDVAFINVEPYKLAYANGKLQPVLDANNQLQPVDAVTQWGLTSEPWVFTVDGKGIVRRSFNGMPSDQELKDAIAEIAGT